MTFLFVYYITYLPEWNISRPETNAKHIELVGDFFNSVGYTKTTGMLNIAVNFDNATVTGDSYLTSLTTDTSAVINGTVTVNGEVVDTSIGGTWVGDLVVKAK